MEDLTPADIEGMRVSDMRDRLRALGLPSTGRKQELKDRLLQYLSTQVRAGMRSPPVT